MSRKIVHLVFYTIIFILLNSCDKELSFSPPDSEPSTGKIALSSKPEGYSIYKNGRLTGAVTPDSLIFLDPGDYTIELKHPLFLDSSFTIDLQNNESKSLDVDFLSLDNFYSSIECTTDPSGAEVILDDSGTGLQTPVTIEGIFPGSHTLKFNKLGYRSKEYKLTFISNAQNTLHSYLEDTTIWLVYTKENSQLISNSLNALGINEHDVWVGTSDAGVMDLSGSKWISYNINNSPLSMNFISSIGVSEESEVLAGTIMGLAYYNGITWIDDPELASLSVNKMTYIPASYYNGGGYSAGHFLVCTNGSGVKDISNGNIAEFEFNSSLPSRNTTCFAFHTHYNSSMYAVGTDSGLYVQSGFTGGGEVIYNSDNAGFISNYITAAAIVGGIQTIYAGVKLSSGVGPALGILYFRNTDMVWEEINLDFAVINDIVVDFSNVWVATSSGLYRLKNYTQVAEHYTTDNTPLESNNIYDIEVDRYGNIWMATGKGLARYKIQ